MDGYTEKKWFVYVGDHHEGPFSLEEIQGKMTAGQVTQASFVWCEGMADWKPMGEVSAFEPVLAAGTPARPPTPPPVGEVGPPSGAAAGGHENEVPIEDTPAVSSSSGGKVARVGRLLKFLILVGVPAALVAGVMQGWIPTEALEPLKEKARPMLLKISGSVPLLKQWVSPIPHLEDVNAVDQEDLKNAAMADPAEAGPVISLVMANSDLFAPQFYVAGNLPDGAQIEIFVEGMPDTLLGQTSFSARGTAILAERLGKTSQFRSPDGKPLPKGKYTVIAMEAQNQVPEVAQFLASAQAPNAALIARLPAHLPKDRKLLARKFYFLGGVEDDTYRARLKEFHDQLRTRALAELAELKQFAGSFDGQIAQSIDGYARSKKIRPAKKAQTNWMDFQKKWSLFDTQVQQKFQSITPENAETDYFYGALYLKAKMASDLITRMNAVHNTYFTTQVNAQEYEAQKVEAESMAQRAVLELKAKIQQAETLPPTPGGLPRKEGL